jgi:GNAT superfamily N-acetyltransferase
MPFIERQTFRIEDHHMDLRIQENCENIDWSQIRDYLKLVGMGYHKPESHQKAFMNSYSVVFVFDRERLIGFGRSVSDGAYQAAIYDIVVIPEYQRLGIGRLIMERILQKISHCNVILYANLGREGFYEKQGFCMMKTAMAKFLRPEIMKEKGFLQ